MDHVKVTSCLVCMCDRMSPGLRDGSLLFMFLRSKGLKVVSYGKNGVDSKSELLTNQLLGLRSVFHVF